MGREVIRTGKQKLQNFKKNHIQFSQNRTKIVNYYCKTRKCAKLQEIRTQKLILTSNPRTEIFPKIRIAGAKAKLKLKTKPKLKLNLTQP